MTDPELSARAEQVQAQAEQFDPDQIRQLAAAAEAHGATADMSGEDVAEVARRAIETSEQLTAQLRRLSVLLGQPAPPPGTGVSGGQ